MSENKELKFVFKVDEQSAQRAKSVIKELIADATRLASVFQNMGGVGGGRAGMQPTSWLSGSVGGAASGQQLISNAASKPGQPQQGGIASIFIAGAESLKNLANMSGGTMRVLSDNVRRAVDEQKRALNDLDGQLEQVAKQYERLKGSQLGHVPGTADVTADTMNELAGESVRLSGERGKAHNELKVLQDQQRAFDKAMNPDEPGAGRSAWSPFKGKTRWGAMGAAVVAGTMGAANEVLAAPFDLVSQQARQAEGLGRVGIQTKQGDLSYAMALMQMSPDKKKEFLGITDTTSTIAAGVVGVKDRLVGALNPLSSSFGNVGDVFRAVEGLNTTQKGRLQKYLDDEIASKPDFQWMLGKFQGDAGSNIRAMRRTGFGEQSYVDLLTSAAKHGAFNEGEVGGAFEAMRGGSRGFAQRALWEGLKAQGAGMNITVAGDLMVAAAPSGVNGSNLMSQITGGLDVVAGEHLAQAMSGAMKSSLFGATSPMGLGTAMGFGLGGNPIMDTYSAEQRKNALPAISKYMGGQDPLGTGINVLAATQAVGPGGDIYTANALVNLMSDPNSLFAAARGDINEDLRAAGVTPELAKKMFQTTEQNIRARNIPQTGSGLSAGTQAIEKLISTYGGNYEAYMTGETPSGLKEKKLYAAQDRLLTELGQGIQARSPETIRTIQEGKAFAAMMSDPSGKTINLGRIAGNAAYGSHQQVYEQARLGESAEKFANFIREAAPNFDIITKALGTIGDTFIRLGQTDIGAKEAAVSLIALAEAANVLTAKLGGKVPKQDLSAIRKSMESGVTVRQAKGEGIQFSGEAPGVVRQEAKGKISPLDKR